MGKPKDRPTQSIGFFSLDVTFSNFIRAVTQGQFASAVFNSFVYSASAAFGALGLAIPLAWISERTDAPARSAIYGLSIVGLIVPGILTVVSWIFLASPNIGLLNEAAAVSVLTLRRSIFFLSAA